MSSRKVRLGDILIRSKIPVDIEDHKEYKRVTIRTKHQGVSIRDFEKGSNIGTKKQFILKAGQFVLSKIDAMYGAFGIAPFEVDGAIITGNFWAYDYDKEMVSIEWLNHFTNSPDFYDLCRRASTGITHRKYLDEDFFLNYELNLPDIDEQNHLVVSIDGIRDKIGFLEVELNYQLTLHDSLNQAILQEAVQGKLVKQDPKDEPASELLKRIKAEKLNKHGVSTRAKKEKPLPPIHPEEIPFEIPENWVWCRLGEIAYVTSGSTPSKDAFVQEGIPFIKMYNLRSQQIDFHYKPQYIKEEVHNEQLKRCRAYPGDILMNIVGPPLGKIAIIPESLPECNFNQAAVLIRPIVKDFNKFIFWFLNEMSEINAIDTKGVAGQDNISVTQAQSIKIPLPPLSEQKRIVAEIEKQFAKTKALKEHIVANQKATEQLLKALLHQAFEVREVEAEEPLGMVAEPGVKYGE